MILVLDASSAVEVVLKRSGFDKLSRYLFEADIVLAPDLFISEISNVFRKYHVFSNLDLDVCEKSIDRALELIDQFAPATELYREAFAVAVKTEHPVYDCIYLVLARRNNAILLTEDKKLKKPLKYLMLKSVSGEFRMCSSLAEDGVINALRGSPSWQETLP